ncbi:hypothetical protein AE23_04888 [Klebsiella pneumoniae UCI 64]|nr:hypothetical protein AE23_04888 [Klebsiella pneumoniae UCI 64]
MSDQTLSGLSLSHFSAGYPRRKVIENLTRHSAPDLGINLPIALTQYLQNDLLVSC